MWKGQTDACEESTGGAGSPISRMPQKTKGGLLPSRQPPKTSQVTEGSPQVTEALAYWQKELASRAESTQNMYLRDFKAFLNYAGKTADELLAQREQDETNKDRKVQRRIESLLNEYVAAKRKEGYSPATLQRYFAAVRSFFDTHYTPLKMRRSDYPKGESLGVRAATRELIRKALDDKRTRHKEATTAVMLFLKDSGLRASDARLLNYGDISEALERGDDFIPITIITQKVKTIAKTFIGYEAIHALKEYINHRKKGTRRIPAETITTKSPLFITTETHNAKRIPRVTMSHMIQTAFTRVNERNLSAHSLRKYLQTTLEAAGINSNWIDQILGHKLINSRDAYSKPTDEQLLEAYTKAYRLIRVYPDLKIPEPAQPPTTYNTPTLEEATALLAKATALLAQAAASNKQ